MKVLIKIFLLGLLLQFFLYNFLTHGIGFDNKSIWLWKEVFIIMFLGILVYYTLKNKEYLYLTKDKTTRYLEILFVLGVGLMFLISTFIQKIPVGQFIMAFKYDFIGFLIYFIFFNIGKFVDYNLIEKIIKFYGKVLKRCLVLALVWYVVISIKPGALKYFGYDRDVHEGRLGSRPPAVYYTKQNSGLVRNQFLFERPISYGFFLTAFWPLFYVLYLRKRSLKKTLFWWIMYGLNVVLTFSRAAWGAWFVEIILLGALTYRRNIKKYLVRIVLPFVLIMLAIIAVGYRHIVSREFSNTGHKVLLMKGLQLFWENPIIGKGAAYAGPGSHQVCAESKDNIVCNEIAQINKDIKTDLKGFNTENQYLQVLVEFGILGFGFWIIIYLYLNLYGFKFYFAGLNKKKELENKYVWYLVAMSIGVISLSIEGLVLHSFIDRMIVYPLMLIQGLIFGLFIYNPVVLKSLKKLS